METLLLLTYGAICVVIFKLFKVPLNKWTVPTAVFGGIVLVGALVFVMNYNHPYSENTREYFLTTPIVPDVAGIVVDVPVEANQPLKAGDVLFKLDPRPFEFKIEGLKAKLVSAEADLKRARELYRKKVGSKRTLDVAQKSVDALKADLHEAEFQLERTVVRAPDDGYVTQVVLRPGMRAVSFPLRPVMVFVPRQSLRFVGWFRQNSLLRLEVGAEAEIAFDAIPGRVFAARVVNVLPALAEGQLQPSGDLVRMGQRMGQQTPPGRVPVILEIDDPSFDAYRKQLPAGAYGQSAIYTEHVHHIAVMRKILLRMASWMNYLFPFH